MFSSQKNIVVLPKNPKLCNGSINGAATKAFVKLAGNVNM